MVNRFREDLGIDISSVLIPKKGVSLEKWAVIACDQYTSEPEYWENVDKFVGDSPSTLRLIFPEVYLERENNTQKKLRIDRINRTMREYLENNYFDEIKDSFIYIERTLRNGKIRKGLLFAIDLELYDYTKGSSSLIRATEGTILDRLPPRIQIRENACLELPHIMILVDDPGMSVIEPLSDCKHKMNKLYSFDLMMNGGHIEGYQVNNPELLIGIYESLMNLKSRENFIKKYEYDTSSPVSPMLFAVGDGNHSLATAKACWEKLKNSLTESEKLIHPARFALVELVNIHDPALQFEPIHRILFNVDSGKVLNSFVNFYGDMGRRCGYEYTNGIKHVPVSDKRRHIIPFLSETKTGYLWVDDPAFTIDVGTLQHFLDHYIQENPEAAIDYVHGSEVVEKLGRKAGNMGFLLSPMNKSDLFMTVIKDGALPRKTFSMGEAVEKRYYLECRKIIPDYLR
ncbi:hypothetical protein CSTERTH_06810 [Thermoclostridium stercorarium subsp. thermolacticum DSM 2910]|uniref:DUF1015 domain-containing protein n=1 Tax=Thermoclostridium stercorarium subsp. thermolacticum DSM 2910 TaxID=1121336 RepID=A0A1B1YDD1_THEST|nr:DUF1015 domain-containing protein [Thermoclostridium stercorarium]ANW98757.1 hypothetical protein CSTERTH_06810 [Thermoclostridium stercorarium subsp. thermolacticum DSM 2910]